MQEQAPTLTPFAEGYAQALRDSLPEDHRDAPLADETLARIVEDCAAFRVWTKDPMAWSDARGGRFFWTDRTARFSQVSGLRDAFPPLTAYLGDDGKVYLREAV